MALTKEDLNAIRQVVSEEVANQLETQLEAKLEDKLESKLDSKLEEKFDAFEQRIKLFVNNRITMAVSELGYDIDERVGRLVVRSNEHEDTIIRHELDINMLKKLATA